MLDMDEAYREYAQMVYKFLLSLCYEEEMAEELTRSIRRCARQRNMMEAVRYLRGFVRLRSISGIGRWNAGIREESVN